MRRPWAPSRGLPFRATLGGAFAHSHARRRRTRRQRGASDAPPPRERRRERGRVDGRGGRRRRRHALAASWHQLHPSAAAHGDRRIIRDRLGRRPFARAFGRLVAASGARLCRYTRGVWLLGAEVELYRAPNFEGGKRLRLRQTAAACANPPSTSSPTLSSASAALGGALVDLPPSWRGTVRSMVLVRECAASNLLCDHRHDDEDDDEGGAAASEGAAGLPAMAATEFRIPAAGEILPYRTPLAPPLGFPAHLAAFARGTFQAYNPSLVVERDGTLTLVARWSNYNFCSPKRKFNDNVKEAKGALMSFVVRGTLNTTTWQLQGGHSSVVGRRLAVWDAIESLYPRDESETVWGAEDPRAVRWGTGGETVVMVAAWERGGVQWQHMVRTRSHNGASDDGHGGGHGGGHGDGGGAESNGTASVLPSASSVRMAVDVRYERPLSQWITQFGTPPSSRPREKNWVPFEWRGGLVEYSLEPRLVLSVDPSTGVGTPSSPSLPPPRSLRGCAGSVRSREARQRLSFPAGASSSPSRT